MAGKMWSDHTTAWRSKASADGLSPQRWNARLKLSESGRKGTSQREYAAGNSIPVQNRAKAEAATVKRMLSATTGKSRPTQIKANVKKMTAEEMRWTQKATDQQIRNKASKRTIAGHATNPWWYR
jgi:hypothetical protein